jgi:4-nitrophenyl phosphatase
MQHSVSHVQNGYCDKPNIQCIKTKEDALKFVNSIDTFLVDCDGVIWLGDRLIPHVDSTFAWLREQGKQLIFLTNNSTKSRDAYVKKFQQLGIAVERVS